MNKLTSVQLFKSIKQIIEHSKQDISVYVNTALTETYFHIGRTIIEYEQQGSGRALYAKETLLKLSGKLTLLFGKGFSVDNLENMRKFYSIYKEDYFKFISKNTKSETLSRKSLKSSKSETLSRKLTTPQKSETLSRKLELSPFKLSWSHYSFLKDIENSTERKFYEIEATQENWSLRELKRQYDSALFERLTLSRNKAKVKELGKKGHVIAKPSDAIKDPYILEFLNFEIKDAYKESDLENEIVNKVKLFLLELGKGFLFLDNQKKIKIDGEYFSIDLVFYHRLLRCFVLFEIKIGTLKHQDLGQLQMYVNYYDEVIKAPEENKTIGIVLCKNKKDSVIKYTLGKDNKQIFASEFKMYFPEKQVLKLLKAK